MPKLKQNVGAHSDKSVKGGSANLAKPAVQKSGPESEGAWSPSSQLARIRWWIELIALVAGSLWALGELAQGVYNPAAEFNIKSVERKRSQASGKDLLVVAATVKTSRGRLQIQQSSFEIQRADSPGKYEPYSCEQLSGLPVQGLFPPGDSSDFACVAEVESQGCVKVRLNIKGVRAIPLLWAIWPQSTWTTSAISCGPAEQESQ